jgi:exodeoxyribonuclease VII small subunit
MNSPSTSHSKNGAAANRMSDESTPTEETTLSFEEAMRELEEVVAALEDGNVPLDQSIDLVRRGQELAAACDATLQQAELTLKTLVATPDGELVEEPLDWDESE